jgi:hypothetical protein
VPRAPVRKRPETPVEPPQAVVVRRSAIVRVVIAKFRVEGGLLLAHVVVPMNLAPLARSWTHHNRRRDLTRMVHDAAAVRRRESYGSDDDLFRSLARPWKC